MRFNGRLFVMFHLHCSLVYDCHCWLAIWIAFARRYEFTLVCADSIWARRVLSFTFHQSHWLSGDFFVFLFIWMGILVAWNRLHTRNYVFICSQNLIVASHSLMQHFAARFFFHSQLSFWVKYLTCCIPVIHRQLALSIINLCAVWFLFFFVPFDSASNNRWHCVAASVFLIPFPFQNGAIMKIPAACLITSIKKKELSQFQAQRIAWE